MKSIFSIGRRLGGGLLAFVTSFAGLVHLDLAKAESVAVAAPRPPDRRELWVPLERLGTLLQREKAVMLTRSQYEALLRDAGVEQSKPIAPPRRVTLSSANYRGRVQGQVVTLEAELRFSVLADEWAEVPLEFSGCVIGAAKLDAESALVPRMPRPAALALGKGKPQDEESPTTLLLRGKGEHVLTLTLTTPLQAEAGQSRISLVVPPTAAGAVTLALPPATEVESDGLPVKAQTLPGGVTATVALTPSPNKVDVHWRSVDLAGGAAVPLAPQVEIHYALDAERLTARYQFHLQSALGDLPEKFEITLPREAKILNVQVAELARWEVREGKVVVTLQPGHRRKTSLQLEAEFSSLGAAALTDLSLPIPDLAGAPRLAGQLIVEADDSVVVREVTADPVVRRMASEVEPQEGGFHGKYTFESRPVNAPRIKLLRALPKLEADLDTLVAFRAEAIEIERTITLRPEQGKRFSATITLPEGEELVSVRQIVAVSPNPAPGGTPETEPQWRAEKNVITVTWKDDAEAAPVIRLRSRQEPARWTDLPAEGVAFPVRDAKIEGAAKVAGYLALTAESAFRLEATPGETLERRDGRNTPVRGEYAWFRRESFDLGVRIFKRPAEVLAVLTGYALPLEGVLDLHAVMKYQFLHGGTREVKIRVPVALAANFQFDGPQIAERTLAGDVWRITFQKELTGAYDLAISAQVPVAKVVDARGAEKGYSFAVDVPVIVPLEVARTSGLWAVEANTETEITFEARGLTELDSLSAPRLPDYQPTHRVIGVFGWIGADYSLGLHGVRHAPAALLATIVDRLELETVASPSGLHRHQATLSLRTAGAQYLDVAMPVDSALLSLLVDGVPLKPVAAPSGGGMAGRMRIRLPAKREANAPVAITMVYETKAQLWENRGALHLVAPQLAAEIPVLQSRWRVWLPDGFTYAGYESSLRGPEPAEEPVLAVVAAARMAQWFGVEKSVMQAKRVDVGEDVQVGAETYEFRGGFQRSDEVAQPQVDALETRAFSLYAAQAPGKPQMPNAAPQAYDLGSLNVRTKGALLPVLIDLPRNGQALTFAGLSAPGQVTLKYDDWWSRARRLWLWFIGGGMVFYVMGRRRPVWRTLWAVLVLTALPMIGWPAAAPVYNAVLAGWLVGAGLHLLVAVAAPRAVKKEVLA